MPGAPRQVTAADIRARFAASRPPKNPRAAVLPIGAEALPGEMRAKMTGELTPAGVLIALIERHEQLHVLLTERSPELKHHAGQVSFPGGRMEAADRDIAMTALRETHEEVGIAPHQVEIAGFLRTTATVTGYAITPVVGLVAEPVNLSIDPVEVKTAFEVPLAFLLDAANRRHGHRDWQGQRIPMVSFDYDGQLIWGATAGIILELSDLLDEL
jgi:8-oxo-dGTP pyrophosphatase MutT (NUDIX family)